MDPGTPRNDATLARETRRDSLAVLPDRRETRRAPRWRTSLHRASGPAVLPNGSRDRSVLSRFVVRGVPKRRAARPGARQRRQVRRAERPEPQQQVRARHVRSLPARTPATGLEHRVRLLLAARGQRLLPTAASRRGLPFHPRARPFRRSERSGLRRPRGARCFPNVRGQTSRRRRPPQRSRSSGR